MDTSISKVRELGGTFGPAVVLIATACAMIVIAYGMESIAPGVHDTFHDFRHVIGMPCH